MLERAKSLPPIEAEELRQRKRSKKKPFAVKYDDIWYADGAIYTRTRRYETRKAAVQGMQDLMKNNPMAGTGRIDRRFNWRIEEEK